MSSFTARLRRPNDGDGFHLHELVARCPPLDPNSVYCNLLQCTDFSETSVCAETDDHRLVGFISGYRPPSRPDTLFVWQVAVDPSFRGQGLALRMLLSLVRHASTSGVRFLETTISPGNHASERLFQRAFAILETVYSTRILFSRERHFSGRHDDEVLYRGGPFRSVPPPSPFEEHA